MQKCTLIWGLFYFIVVSSALHTDDKLVTSVISGVSKVLKYYKENYQSMNLDGIYGLRLLHG